MTSFNERDRKITTSHEKKGFHKIPLQVPKKHKRVTHTFFPIQIHLGTSHSKPRLIFKK